MHTTPSPPGSVARLRRGARTALRRFTDGFVAISLTFSRIRSNLTFAITTGERMIIGFTALLPSDRPSNNHPVARILGNISDHGTGGYHRRHPRSRGKEHRYPMLRRLDRLLSYEMKVSEFLGTLIIIGIPYGLVGVVWTLTHTAHLRNLYGADLVISFLGSILCWPVLIFANVTMT